MDGVSGGRGGDQREKGTEIWGRALETESEKKRERNTGRRRVGDMDVGGGFR